ncbi:F0F1 ATP synthase subunit gamma [Candidatus Gottesmanbacteria bacterium]|nr:F0F1 ATP synthase subunit gamma [Candidatus Gottesmanbacteria bacterium]
MASIRLIRRRIRSAQNIAQITKAMQMVSASKMKRAQQAAELGKLYADKIYRATRELAARTEENIHPLLAHGNPTGRTLVILISTNKGLCGGLNTNLFRQVLSWFPKNDLIDYVTIGKKGESFVVRSGRKLTADFSETARFLDHVPAVTQLLVSGFLNGTYKQIFVGFSSFINALKQMPVNKLILPLADFGKEKNEEESLHFSEFVIEPTVDDVLSNLLPHYLENQLRAAVLEAEACDEKCYGCSA